MKRLVITSLAALGVLTLSAPAFAHEQIDPNTVPTGKPEFFTLTVANEKAVDLTSVRLTAPKGLDFGATTHDSPGWTNTKSNAAITWTGSAIKPNKFETFGFEIEGADQPGTFTYTATMTYADKTTEDADIALTAAAGSGSTAGKSNSSGGKGLAAVALALGAAALALSIGALARGRKAGSAAAPSGPAPSSGKQDW